MRVLCIHNYYQQRGGEDEVFVAETDLLEAHGHEVIRYTIHNDSVNAMNSATLAMATIWNRASYLELRQLIRDKRPQIAHFHNTLPLVSPAGYYAAKAEGVPVVQTLHNYRLLCPNGELFRQGQPCQACIGESVPLPGIVHACYRESRLATGAIATMLSLHRLFQTWTKTVNLYIALSDFARNKFIEGGLPAEKIVIKPNFVHPSPTVGAGYGGYALFVGRLAPEKGISTLLSAWSQLSDKLPLKIVGDGPLAAQVERAVQQMPNIQWLGRRTLTEVYELIGNATCLIFPSEWYETFGRVAIEAFAKGTPVVASNIGAIAELVESGRTGLLFQPADSQALAAKVEWLLANPVKLAQMRQEARAEYENKYTADKNYQRTMEIYEQVCHS
jgi:glycosyltransferase involved in cell wall biosynthesis